MRLLQGEKSKDVLSEKGVEVVAKKVLFCSIDFWEVMEGYSRKEDTAWCSRTHHNGGQYYTWQRALQVLYKSV